MSALGLHEVAGQLVTDDELGAMRFWLDDNGRGSGSNDATTAEVVAGVDRSYTGGVRAFLDQLRTELLV
jgi:hypothetical protein